MHLLNKIKSNDSTIKYFFTGVSEDKQVVESCLLDLEKHGTVICISSQLGCIQKCKFCASGALPYSRNLTIEEMLFQVNYIIKDEPSYFSSNFQITFMGSGEPFQNINNVLNTCCEYFRIYKNLSKINISTVLPFLNVDLSKFEKFKGKMHIQYSLHFTQTDSRNIHFNWELPSITNSISYLNELSRILDDVYSVNYFLCDSLNDSKSDAEALINIIKKSRGYLKISELSPIKNAKYIPSTNFKSFITYIKNSGIIYDIFHSKGTDINAGCGQFYNESII